MKLPFSFDEIDPEEFNIRPVDIKGETCHLIYPKAVGPKWNKNNLILRSSLWNSGGYLISAGYKKFFNYTEAPQVTPDPVTLENANAFEKLDGSLLICSLYNDEWILRTRGTIDARIMENGDEIDYFVNNKYKKFFHNRVHKIDNMLYDGGPVAFTYLFEWVSPKNQIVIFYPEPDIRLVGIVDNQDYSYFSQNVVDEVAKNHHLLRPTRYTFNSVEELYTSVKAFEGKEGICLYYNGDQDIKKFKGLDYLAKHSFMSKVSNKETINLFATLNYPDYDTFYNYIVKQFDFEIAEYARPFMENVTDAYTKWETVLMQLKYIAKSLKDTPRKEAADYILNTSFMKQYSGIIFGLLDGKEPGPETIRKFLCAECGVKP